MGEPEPARGRLRVTVTGLGLRYRPDAEPVLDGVEHVFEPGTLTLLSGPSGSGKSTLLYVLGLMLRPSCGEVRWNAQQVSTTSDAFRSRMRAQHVGFVFQDALLDLSRTALQNIEESSWLAGLDARPARQRAQELLDRFGVGHRADHRPGEISGGQAQRIALCRALVKSPALVLADEPTGNLDEDSAEVVWEALAREAQDGATVIVATHESRRLDRATGVVQLAGPLPTPASKADRGKLSNSEADRDRPEEVDNEDR